MNHDTHDCPLCRAHCAFVARDSDRAYFHCQRCDMISVPKIWHLSIADERARYAHHHNTLECPSYVDMLERIIRRLRRHVAPPARVIDFGCGENQVLVTLLNRVGFCAEGCDPLYGFHADPGTKYDAIISTEAFEHLAAPREEIERLASMLAPRGWLIVTTLFHPGRAAFVNWWYGRDPTHVAFYSHATMRWIASELGLEIVEMDERNFFAARLL